MLEPQLKLPNKSVWPRNVAKNLSGSKASRTAIFDLHCKDDAGDLIEIEVQIREVNNFMKRLAFYASEMVANQAEPGQDWDYDIQPTYVIALTRFSVFPDERAVRLRRGIFAPAAGENLHHPRGAQHVAGGVFEQTCRRGVLDPAGWEGWGNHHVTFNGGNPALYITCMDHAHVGNVLS